MALLENVMCHSSFAVRLFEGFAVLAAGPASVEAGAKLHAETEVSTPSVVIAGGPCCVEVLLESLDAFVRGSPKRSFIASRSLGSSRRP